MHNLSQSDFNLLANYTYAKIIIVPTIKINFFGHQYDAVVQLAD